MNKHLEVTELLPWFVNGTLNEHEHSLVNEHLQECEKCNRDVIQLMETSKLFHAEPEPSGSAVAQARNDFLNKLEIESNSARTSRRWMVPAAMAASLLVVALLLTPFSRQDEVFETLGKNSSGAGPIIQLVFDSNATEQTIRRLILSDQGRIISGPTEQGVYRIELPLDKDPQLVLQKLRSHPETKFAELEINP
jgi:hypothetical protein